MRVHSTPLENLNQHIVEYHSLRCKGIFFPDNQWTVLSVPNGYNRMKLDDLRDTFNSSVNFRGIMFELFNFKAHAFLRIMKENDKMAHKLKSMKYSESKFKCLQTYKSIQAFGDQFDGLVSEPVVYRKKLCTCNEAKYYQSEAFAILTEFIKFVLKPDFLSDESSFQKLNDIFTIERFQRFEIEGILTLVSVLLDRHE